LVRGIGKVINNLKFGEGDIIRDKFGNEYEIGHIFDLNVQVKMIKFKQETMALTQPYGRFWFTRPGNSWWCLAIKVEFQPDPVTGIDPCEYLLRLDEVEKVERVGVL
jgi:hypothetical protein